ncbi:MAG: tRNA-dihydrouridine synthase family protein, partial [Eubacteriales bacterium]
LTNDAKKFIDAAKEIKELGYDEINLNLGCPSGTVVAKKRGSGFLADPDILDRFLYEIFEGSDMKISIKTRLGIREVEEFEEILEVYNHYKMEELILHPRLQKEMYKYPVHREVVADILTQATNPICYNGDIYTLQDGIQTIEEFPQIIGLMLGRGSIINPALARQLKGGIPLQKEELRCFHDKLYQVNQEYLSGDTNLLYRMKAYWYYFIMNFEGYEKIYKKLCKCTKLAVYHQLVDDIFKELKFNHE